VLAKPPQYQHACAGQPMLSQLAPQIRSPQVWLTYQLGKSPEQQKIALQASFDGAVTQAHWFIDNRYLGAIAPDDTLFWQGEAGEFQLRVVDDLGGVASQPLRITDQ
jgi:penicillin-binding protein 1C